MRTPNDLVYGETNRYPLYVNSAVNCIRYWLKLLKMTDDRLPRKVYDMLCDLDRRGKSNWVSNLRQCLCEFGFGYAWEYQGVGEENRFVQLFRQRLIDCRWQDWESHIQSSDRFDMYKGYTSSHSVKRYLTLNMDRHLRFILTRFRFGISEINVHTHRYKNLQNANLICPMCEEATEDELHVVLRCPALNELREKFIPKKYYAHPCLFRFCLLMSSSNDEIVRKLALYLYKAFQLRGIIVS